MSAHILQHEGLKLYTINVYSMDDQQETFNANLTYIQAQGVMTNLIDHKTNGDISNFDLQATDMIPVQEYKQLLDDIDEIIAGF